MKDFNFNVYRQNGFEKEYKRYNKELQEFLASIEDKQKQFGIYELPNYNGYDFTIFKSKQQGLKATITTLSKILFEHVTDYGKHGGSWSISIVYNKENGRVIGRTHENAGHDYVTCHYGINKINDTFNPLPIDTTNLILPNNLINLIELISKNNHNKWAKELITKGWTYGEVYEYEYAHDPLLVPYEDLPEEEKEKKKQEAIELLKIIVNLGYNITKNAK